MKYGKQASRLFKTAVAIFFLWVGTLPFFLFVAYYAAHRSAEILKASRFLYMGANGDVYSSINMDLIPEKDRENIIFFAMSEDVLNSSPGVPVAYFNGKGFWRRPGFVSAIGAVDMGAKWEERFMVRGLGVNRKELDGPSFPYETISFQEVIQKIKEREASEVSEDIPGREKEEKMPTRNGNKI